MRRLADACLTDDVRNEDLIRVGHEGKDFMIDLSQSDGEYVGRDGAYTHEHVRVEDGLVTDSPLANVVDVQFAPRDAGCDTPVAQIGYEPEMPYEKTVLLKLVADGRCRRLLGDLSCHDDRIRSAKNVLGY